MPSFGVGSTGKTPLTITGVKAQGWTCDGTAHTGYTGVPGAEGYDKGFRITCYPDGQPPGRVVL